MYMYQGTLIWYSYNVHLGGGGGETVHSQVYFLATMRTLGQLAREGICWI